MNSAKENQSQAICEKRNEKLTEEEKEKKAAKSNSELMAEFFAITSDEDKNE